LAATIDIIVVIFGKGKKKRKLKTRVIGYFSGGEFSVGGQMVSVNYRRQKLALSEVEGTEDPSSQKLRRAGRGWTIKEK